MAHAGQNEMNTTSSPPGTAVPADGRPLRILHVIPPLLAGGPLQNTTLPRRGHHVE